MTKVTILTTTYNRANTIERCYKGLLSQTVKDFEWVIIDDGSTDNTTGIVGKMMKNNAFPIQYYKKENGGKHTALNYAHPYISGEWMLIVDDDDYLIPNAIETIITYIEQYGTQASIWCLNFQKGLDENNPVCDWKATEDIISNHIDFRIKGGVKGDCAEVVRTEVFKSFLYPEFPGEHFFGESSIWIEAAKKYDTVYIKKVIYICEYLEGGLSKKGRSMRVNNPLGGMYTSNLYLNSAFPFRIQLKRAILYDCYKISAKKKDIRDGFPVCQKPFLCFLTYPIGLFFYEIWK